jgi:hypothetical protein
MKKIEPDYVRMKGWVSFYTVTLPHPVTDAQRQLHRNLSGPGYLPRRRSSGSIISYQEFCIMMVNLPDAVGSHNTQHGWVKELRQVGGEPGGEAGTVVQDAFFYTKWLSKDAEEEQKRALPEVEYSWDDELREIGALAAKEEHVDLVCVAFGRAPEKR